MSHKVALIFAVPEKKKEGGKESSRNRFSKGGGKGHTKWFSTPSSFSYEGGR